MTMTPLKTVTWLLFIYYIYLALLFFFFVAILKLSFAAQSVLKALLFVWVVKVKAAFLMSLLSF